MDVYEQFLFDYVCESSGIESAGVNGRWGILFFFMGAQVDIHIDSRDDKKKSDRRVNTKHSSSAFKKTNIRKTYIKVRFFSPAWYIYWYLFYSPQFFLGAILGHDS